MKIKKVTKRRAGRCYQLAGRAMLDGKFGAKARLVHGVLCRVPLNDTEPFRLSKLVHGHAWIERGDEIWDPVHDQWFPADVYRDLFWPLEGPLFARARRRFTKLATAKKLIAENYWGSWLNIDVPGH